MTINEWQFILIMIFGALTENMLRGIVQCVRDEHACWKATKQ